MYALRAADCQEGSDPSSVDSRLFTMQEEGIRFGSQGDVMIIDRIRYRFLSRMRREEGVSPKVNRSNKDRLGASPRTVFEASLASSLSMMILLFLFFPQVESTLVIPVKGQEVVTIEEIEHTKQELRSPPPPRPPIPIEAPSDEAVEDVEIASTELNVQQEVTAPPPQAKADDEEQYFVAVEDMPQIIGGTAAIARVLVYPDIALRAQVQGTVVVLAYVNETGEIMRVDVIKGIGAGCDEAAVNAVKKVKFIPGKQRGKAVKVKVSIPVVFRIRNS